MEKEEKQSSQRVRNKVYLKYEIQNVNELYFKLEDSENCVQDNKINQKTNGTLFTLRNLPPNTFCPHSPLINPLSQFRGQQIPNLTSSNTCSKLNTKEPNLKKEQKNNQNINEKRHNLGIFSERKVRQQKNNEIDSSIYENDERNLQEKNCSNSLHKPSISNEKGQSDHKSQHCQISNDSKKNKKGLAYISLKVKNIVLQHSKLTYKQVSDLVLESCEHELSNLHPNEREKEVKNIRRRVYDALNVLVSVDILGRNNRQVVVTQWTNFQGKKLTSQWQSIRAQEEEVNIRKKRCQNKQKILQQVINKYKSILSLRKRNEFKLQHSKNSKYKHNGLPQQIQFPFLIIPRNISVFEVQILKDNNSQTVIIRGRNMRLISDVDVVQKLDIRGYEVDISPILKEVQKFQIQQNTFMV